MRRTNPTNNGQRTTDTGHWSVVRSQFLAATIMLLCQSMLGAGIGFMQQKPLSFSGLNLFSPGVTSDSGGTSLARQDRSGFTLDSKTAGDSAWVVFGTNLGPCVVDAVIKCNAIYDSGSNTNFDHGGFGVAYNNANNWSSLVMPNPNNGQVDIRDRDNLGNEHNDDTGNMGITIAHEYRVRIDYTNAPGSNSMINVWDNQTGTQLVANRTHNFFANCPTNGWLTFHTYGSSWTMTSCAVFKPDGVTVVTSGPQLWCSEYSTVGNGTVADGRLIKAKNILQICADNSNTSNNGWNFDDCPLAFQDGTITGYLTLVSGRMMGILFRSDGAGHGYILTADTGNGNLRFFKDPGSPALIAEGPSITLSTGTEYPFTLTVRGNVFSFTINGVTFTTSDSSYQTTGSCGIQTFGSVANIRDLTVLP